MGVGAAAAGAGEGAAAAGAGAADAAALSLKSLNAATSFWFSTKNKLPFRYSNFFITTKNRNGTRRKILCK